MDLVEHASDAKIPEPPNFSAKQPYSTLGADGFTDTGTGPGSPEADYIDWLTINDNTQSVIDDVTRIRSHPLVPGTIPIYGYIYDVTTGRLIEVPDATSAGSPA